MDQNRLIVSDAVLMTSAMVWPSSSGSIFMKKPLMNDTTRSTISLAFVLMPDQLMFPSASLIFCATAAPSALKSPPSTISCIHELMARVSNMPLPSSAPPVPPPDPLPLPVAPFSRLISSKPNIVALISLAAFFALPAMLFALSSQCEATFFAAV